MRAPLSWLRDYAPLDAPVDRLAEAFPSSAWSSTASRRSARASATSWWPESSTSGTIRTPSGSAWSTWTPATARPRSCAGPGTSRSATSSHWRRWGPSFRVDSRSRAARCGANGPTACCAPLRSWDCPNRPGRRAGCSSWNRAWPTPARRWARPWASNPTWCSTSTSPPTDPTPSAWPAWPGIWPPPWASRGTCRQPAGPEPSTRALGAGRRRWPTRRPVPPLHRHRDRGSPRRPIAGVARAATDPGGDAAHQQRRRRLQLRDAGTGPAQPRLRPRSAPGRRRRARRAARPAGGDPRHPGRRRAAPGRRRLPDLRRRGVRRSASAGIMGGASAEIRAGTKRVLLEAAWFWPMAVARTGARLGLHSEARVRFERGVDPEIAGAAVDRFVALLAAIPGGESCAADRRSTWRHRSTCRRPGRSRCAPPGSTSSSGPRSPTATSRRCWHPSGSPPNRTPGILFSVRVPTWRMDCTREIDLIEEVARMWGYHRIERTVPAGARACARPAGRAHRRPAPAPAGPGHPGRRRGVRGLDHHLPRPGGSGAGRARRRRRGGGEPARPLRVAASHLASARSAEGPAVQPGPAGRSGQPLRDRPGLRPADR